MTTGPLTIQLNILEGKAQEQGPYTGIYPKAEAKEGLYLLIETPSQNQPEESHRALEIIHRNFATRKASLTTSLAQGIKEAQNQLGLDLGLSVESHASALGTVCAAHKDGEVYLVQTGPASAYVIRGTEIICLGYSDEGAVTPLRVRGVQIRLYRHLLQEGDIILLAPSRLNSMVSTDALPVFFSHGLEGGMQRLYRTIRRERRFALLALTFPTVDNKPSQKTLDDTSKVSVSRVREEPQEKLTHASREAAAASAPSRPRDAVRRARRTRVMVPAPPDNMQSLGLELRQLPRWASRYNTSYVANLVTAALLTTLVIMGLAVAWQLPGYLRQEAEGRFSALISKAELIRTEALASSNRDIKRQKLGEASALVRTALAMKSTDSYALSLRESIQNYLSEMDAVQELTGIRLLADFRAIKTSPTLLRDLLLHGNKLYLLDKGSDRIFEYPTLYDEGARQAGNLPVPLATPKSPSTNLTHLFWMTKGGLWPRDSLMVFDEAKRLTEYSLKDPPKAISLRGAEGWASLQAAAGYEGNLYILDPVGSQVWRYVPTDNGYDSERRGILGGADIRDAVDLAIDGDLYILNRSGQILKLSGASTQPFSQEGLDKPLVNPTSIFTSARSKLVYVVDAGNRRIVVFDKTGKFQRQLVSPLLSPVRDLYVDEGQKTIYLISDNLLYAASLP